MGWIIASQPLLLAVIWSYGALRLLFFEAPPLPDSMADMARLGAAQWGMPVDEYFRRINQIIVGSLSIIALLYQGGMTVFYARRRDAVAAASTAPSRITTPYSASAAAAETKPRRTSASTRSTARFHGQPQPPAPALRR